MTPFELSGEIKRLAAIEGFDRCGVAAAGAIPRGEYFRDWLASGRAGTMGYLHRHADSRLDVRNWLPWARGIVVLALNYRQPSPPRPADEPRGRVAMYAWGEDYHVVLDEKLARLTEAMRAGLGRDFECRRCVDTSPVIEREWAAAAGVGWIGKNTLAMHESIGSYFFLAELITDLDLAVDAPAIDHCGTCTRCLEACPTAAFPAPYTMDARRCISYLTIEHRAEIEPALAVRMDDWIYGCDICQQVCPHNRHETITGERRFRTSGDEAVDAAYPALATISEWSDEACAAAVAGKASDRAKPHMWRRNAEIAMANAELAKLTWQAASPREDRSCPDAEAQMGGQDSR